MYVFGLYVYMDCGAGALYFSYSVEIMTIWVRLLLLFIKVVLRKCTEMTWMTSQIDDLCLPASEKTLSPVSTPIKDQKSLGKCNHTPEGHQG